MPSESEKAAWEKKKAQINDAILRVDRAIKELVAAQEELNDAVSSDPGGGPNNQN